MWNHSSIFDVFNSIPIHSEMQTFKNRPNKITIFFIFLNFKKFEPLYTFACFFAVFFRVSNKILVFRKSKTIFSTKKMSLSKNIFSYFNELRFNYTVLSILVFKKNGWKNLYFFKIFLTLILRSCFQYTLLP